MAGWSGRGKQMQAEVARQLFNYAPETGVLSWKVNRNHAAKAGQAIQTRSQGYIRVRTGGRYYLGHRLAWLLTYGEWPNGNLDHANGIRHDNRIANLRLADHVQQNANKVGWSRLGLPKGVSPSRHRYQARLHANSRLLHLGVFDSPEEAHAAYCDAARKHFGDFFHDGSRRTA